MKTAAQIAQMLSETSNAYHAGLIDYDEFSARQRATWDLVGSDVGLRSSVLSYLRG